MAAWLRLYAEMMDDPKVGELSDSEFRTWIGLLCLACKSESEGDTGHTIERANWALRRDINPDLPHLLSLNLIVATPAKTIQITNWSKRQYRSDSSAERVRRYRNGDEALPKRAGNALDKSRAEQSRAEEELPSGVPVELWDEWREDRKAKGKPLTARAIAKQFKFLAGQPEADRIAIIRTAIDQDWQGFWPLKRGSHAQAGKPVGAPARIRAAIAARDGKG